MKKPMILLLGFASMFAAFTATAADDNGTFAAAPSGNSVEDNAQYFASLAETAPDDLIGNFQLACTSQSRVRILLAIELAADRLTKENKPEAAKRLRDAAREFNSKDAKACAAPDAQPAIRTDFLRPRAAASPS